VKEVRKVICLRLKKLVSSDHHRYIGEEEEEAYVNRVYGWQISIPHFPMA